MAQWNLSVDLRGRGGGLAQVLRDSAGQARTLQSAVHDARSEIRELGSDARTTRGSLSDLAGQTSTTATRLERLDFRARRAANRLRDLAEQARQTEAELQRLNSDITVRVRLDDQTSGAALALRQVQNAADDTARVLRTLRGRAAATADALDQVRSSAFGAAAGLRSFNAAARTADGRVDTLAGRTRTLNTNLGDLNGTLGTTGTRLGGLRGRLGTAGNATGNMSAQSRNLYVIAGMLATALIPVAAATVPIAAGMAAASAGAVAFGAALIGQVVALAEIAQAQKKYEEAVEEHGKGSQEAAKAELARLRALKDVPGATREAAAGYEALAEDYKEWSDALADDTMPVAIKSMSILSSLMDHTTPLVRGTSDEFERFLTILAGGMQTQEFEEFMDEFTTFAVETLARANSGVVRLSRSLDTGEIGADYREFLSYARENGPLVSDTLGEIARALLKVLAAGSEAGVGVLTVVNAMAQLINAIPTEVLSVLLQVAFALKAVQLAGLAVGLIAPGIALAATNVRAFIRSARFGGVAAAISGVAQQLTLLQKATAVLAVLTLVVMGVSALADEAKGAPPEVDKLTTSLKKLGQAGQFTGELKKTFGDMDGLVDKIGEIGKARRELDEEINRSSLGVGWLDGMRRDVRGFVDELVDGEKSLNALEEDFKGLDDAMAQLVTSGHSDLAAANFNKIAAAAKAQGYSVKDVENLLPGYTAALEDMKAEQDIAARSMGLFGAQAQQTRAHLDEQKASADGLRAAIQALNDVNRAALGGMIGFEQAIDDAAEAAKKNAGALEMNGGVLNLNSEKARAAATALQELGTKTDEAAASARESGASWETVAGIYDRGRQQLVRFAQTMGLSKSEAQALAASILDIPDEKKTRIEMEREDALAGLDAVIAKIKATPNAKSVTVNALTDVAMGLLRDLGFRVQRLPNGKVTVTALTGAALSNIGAVQAARDALQDKSITVTTYRRTVIEQTVQRPQRGEGSRSKFAAGGLVQRAAQGLFVPGYAPRQDTVPAILSPGEGVLVPETVRQLGSITGLGGAGAIKALNDWGRYGTVMRFADGGTVTSAGAPAGLSREQLLRAAVHTRVGVTDLAASRHVVVIKDGGDTNVTIHTGRTVSTAADIGYEVGRQIRRARRGGVAARA